MGLRTNARALLSQDTTAKSAQAKDQLSASNLYYQKLKYYKINIAQELLSNVSLADFNTYSLSILGNI